jgi:hypothetical protein
MDLHDPVTDFFNLCGSLFDFRGGGIGFFAHSTQSGH